VQRSCRRLRRAVAGAEWRAGRKLWLADQFD
jgi:hypothetical protein